MVSLSSPLSLYAIPAMWVISYYPARVRSSLIKQAAGNYDNVRPRGNVAKILDQKNVSPDLAARIQRVEGAHINGLENLPFFGLAVLAGNLAGLDNVTLNVASGLFLALRVAYNYIYFNQSSRRSAGLRTLTWLASVAVPFYLFVKSASLVNQKTL
ncbi:hypothetical protein GALMADRAFT_242432 [Galerina marginata CBS 339.88]|uniref:Uncharacterized protein n=1 Tax=Galerina marginata (strain CBS 339.88) TaxID=685588 RepID=A0A067TCT1_GALM3|nr:hypothetical protein GALMADRAFT_242432 [Galerina marginata CBS 339.88]